MQSKSGFSVDNTVHAWQSVVMNGYAKLHSSILASSIWGEKNHVRILWITMLAMADREGFVGAAIPGLAQLARLSIEEVKDGLEVLKSPDPYSRTKTNEGRRVTEEEGGWLIINYADHRDRMNKEERAAYKAGKMREYREKKRQEKEARGQSVEQCGQCGHIADSDTDSDTKEKSTPKPPKGGDTDPLILEIYEAYPLKVARSVAIKAIGKAAKKHDPNFILERTKLFGEMMSKLPKEQMDFVCNPATWFNQERYNDDPSTWVRVKAKPAPSGNQGGSVAQRIFLENRLKDLREQEKVLSENTAEAWQRSARPQAVEELKVVREKITTIREKLDGLHN